MYRHSQADKDQRSKYQKTHRRQFLLALYDTKDSEMISFLENKRPSGQYLKHLVEEDMKRN